MVMTSLPYEWFFVVTKAIYSKSMVYGAVDSDKAFLTYDPLFHIFAF